MKIKRAEVLVMLEIEGEPLRRYGRAEVATELLKSENGDRRIVLGHAAEIALEAAKHLN